MEKVLQPRGQVYLVQDEQFINCDVDSTEDIDVNPVF